MTRQRIKEALFWAICIACVCAVVYLEFNQTRQLARIESQLTVEQMTPTAHAIPAPRDQAA